MNAACICIMYGYRNSACTLPSIVKIIANLKDSGKPQQNLSSDVVN